MAWRPSTDITLQNQETTAFWAAFETHIDAAMFSAPLPRGDWQQLQALYVGVRKGDTRHVDEMRSRVPEIPYTIELWPTDIELLDFVLHYPSDRTLILVGPRGAGKTSLLHFVEGVLENSGVSPPPQLLLLDGNSLRRGATVGDVADLLLEKLRRRATIIAEPFRASLRAAIEVLERRQELGASERMKRAARDMAAALPQADARLLTIVFDNLDHHSPEVVEMITDVAKGMHISSRLGTILCVRKSTYTHITRTDTARAFIRYSVPVRTPRVEWWLHNIGTRVLISLGNASAVPKVRGHEVGPQGLQRTFTRLVELLTSRHRGDSALEMLEAVSANDTRHLARLVRRILTSPQLPDTWLLDEGELDGTPEFHPLSSVVNGRYALYQHNADVPNLLWFGDSEGNEDSLLPQRVLTLLSGSDIGYPVKRLTSWLAELGYHRSTVVECTKVLIAAHLIECSETDVIDGVLKNQWSLQVTDAGEYYLNRLLRMADYLALAVVDVPLEHEAFHTQPPESFAARLSSLLEYGALVQREEARQVNRLIKDWPPTSELRRVADVLQKGGLLMKSVVAACEELAARSRNSRSPSVAAQLPKLEEDARRWRLWVDSAEQRLRDVVNRTRRAAKAPDDEILCSEGSTEVAVSFDTIGDDTQVVARVRTDCSELPMLLSMNCGSATTRLTGSVPVPPSSRSDSVKEPSVDQRVSIGTLPPNGALAQSDISVQLLSIPTYARRTALMAVDTVGKHVEVRFHVFDGFKDSSDLIATCPEDELLQWSAEHLESLSGLVASGARIDETLRVIGTAFADQFVSPVGLNLIASQYNLIDSIILHSAYPQVPWELLCPPPVDGQLLPSIGEKWNIIRWPSSIHQLALRTTLSDFTLGCGRLRTVGLPPRPGTPWRVDEPRNITAFLDVVSDCDTLHLVGHWDKSGLHFRNGDWTLDAKVVTAFGFRGPRYVILSGCGAATPPQRDNVAIQLAARSGAVTYSPLVVLRDEDADSVDLALAAVAGPDHTSSVEQCFRAQRAGIPLVSLYVRYGLSTAKR